MIDYKESLFLNQQLITRADFLLNTNHMNPFDTRGKRDKDENEDENKSDENSANIPTFDPKSFQEICNPDIIASSDSLKIIYDFVSSSQFDLSQNQQFFDEKFADGICKYLLSGQPDYYTEKAILILSNLWYFHPNEETPLTNPSIILLLFDILKHVNSSFYNIVLISLINYYEISLQTRHFILYYDEDDDIFAKLRDFLLIADNKEYIETGIRFLYHLFKKREEEQWANFLQFLPIIPMILEKSDVDNQIYILYTLSIMIEDDQIFEYCVSNQIHSELAKYCQRTILRQSLAYYLYKCVYEFVKRGYYKVFYKKSIFTEMQGILRIKERHNISTLFYTISLLIDNYAETFFDQNIHLSCIEYAKEGRFDNKISATFCVAKFVIYSPPDICDQIARNDCIEILCDILQCFDDIDIILPLRAFKRLIDLNRVLYCNIMIYLQIFDYLIEKYDEEMGILTKNPDDALFQEIVALLKFINDNIDDTLKENDNENE